MSIASLCFCQNLWTPCYNIHLFFASSHLYMRVCPSVRPSVRPLVRGLVTLSSKTGKSMILMANNDVSCNHIIIQSFHHHEDASLALWALFRGNAKLKRESNEQEKSGYHPCKNGHLTPKWCIKGKIADDEP